MGIAKLEIGRINIPFKQAFRHSSAERSRTESVWVAAYDDSGHVGYGESCPRPYVTGEDLASTAEFFKKYEKQLSKAIADVDSMRAWIQNEKEVIDANPSAWCAMELAVLDLLAKQSQVSVEELLGLTPLSGDFRYSAIIGDGDIDSFRTTFERYAEIGMTDFKIKVSGEPDRDRPKFDILKKYDASALRVRLDGNNLWDRPAQAVEYIRKLDYPIFAFEEPLQPNQYRQLAELAATTGLPIILDESFLRAGQFDLLGGHPGNWLINLRISKMGGLLRSLQLVKKTRSLGIGIIVGAQVGETSLLTRAALTVAHEARDILVGQEGAFGTLLLQNDIWNPELRFGMGGRLDITGLRTAGFGLRLATETVCLTVLP